MGTYTSTFTCKCAHSSVWMIKMSLRLNFPSRRTHKGLRVMTKKIPLWILTKCCPHIEKTPMCRVLLADFIYHPNCGWSESLVGGKGLIDWANFAHSYLRIFLVKLSIIAYNKTLRSWVIFFLWASIWPWRNTLPQIQLTCSTILYPADGCCSKEACDPSASSASWILGKCSVV